VEGSDIPSSVSPHAQALSLYIQNAIEHLMGSASQKQSGNEKEQSGLIYLGNWQDAYPRLLVTDPILEPVDKLVWQIIRLHINAPGAVTSFPSYEVISTYANIKSNHTISRALAILRATRWLSLCARVRGKSGRYLGNIYVLHDEPVTLGDAMYLDGDYMAFLQNSTQHKHPRVNKIVESVLATIQDLIDGGQDAMGERIQTRTYERRIGTVHQTKRENEPALLLAERTNFFAISDPQIKQLANQDREDQSGTQKIHMTDSETDQVQILHTVEEQQTSHVQKMHTEKNGESSLVQKMQMDENSENDRVQYLHMDTETEKPETQKLHTAERSSSCSNNINTTTTESNTPRVCARADQDLHFPPGISANERNLALMYLNPIDDDQQQEVLDEWHGRLQAADRRNDPIGNPIGYLASLCRRMKTGEFQITIGLRIRDQREQALRRAEKDKQRAEHEKQRQAEMLSALKNKPEGELSGIERRMLKMRKRSTENKGSSE